MTQPYLLTVEEAAERLAIGRTTLYNLMDSGAVAWLKIGRCRRIRPEALAAFIERAAEAAAA
jgi:excisionase family DNA binding protein